MDKILRSRFTKEEISLAASIGASQAANEVMVKELFSSIQDPLLSVDETCELLALNPIPKADMTNVMNILVDEGFLESSTTTMRPLDSEECTLYRKKDVPYSRLKIQAQEARIAENESRFVFTCDGRLIRAIARVDRLDALTGSGNQREEVRRHVANIAEGIENGNQVPNSILLVILKDQITSEEDYLPQDLETSPESFVRVERLTNWEEVQSPVGNGAIVQHVRLVELDFPFRFASFDEEKVALLVDGQQRTAALSMVDIDKVPSFALSVNAVAADADSAKKIFQVANSTQKIATEFSRALMATMTDAPPHLRKEQSRTLAVAELAIKQADSPFFERVKYSGVKESKSRPIAYNSLFAVVSEFADSALPLQAGHEQLAIVVKRSYNLVKSIWPDAWKKKPTDSKLVHGTGLRAMASVIIGKLEGLAQADKFDLESDETWGAIEKSLLLLQPLLIWSSAELGGANKTAEKIYKEQIMGAQNTSQDIANLARFLKKESLLLDTQAMKKKK